MNGPHDNQEDFNDIERRLRGARERPSGFELDELKRRSMAQARRGSDRRVGFAMRSRTLTAALAVTALAGMTAVGIGASGGGGSGGSAAVAQYHGHNANAPGFYCNQAGASKKHSQGQKGTPFSQCVHQLTHHVKSHPSTSPK